jgi:hypothetical protein
MYVAPGPAEQDNFFKVFPGNQKPWRECTRPPDANSEIQTRNRDFEAQIKGVFGKNRLYSRESAAALPGTVQPIPTEDALRA